MLSKRLNEQRLARLFPSATSFSAKEGDPPHYTAYSGGRGSQTPVGYVFWTTEILIEALRHRARVVEVPVTIAARAGGETKKPASLRYGWNFSKVIVQTWLR